MAGMMLRIPLGFKTGAAGIRSVIASRTYATVSTPSTSALASPAGLTPQETYDADEDPQLAGMDYPKLSTASRQTRSARGWWDSQERINFDEPIPENDDIQSMWAPDVHKVRPSSAFAQLITAFGGLALFSGAIYMIQAPPPALPRAYPFDGLVRELSGTDDAAYAARPSSANEIEE